jgi:3-oxoacyl-[acyl-carrier protein] reductase
MKLKDKVAIITGGTRGIGKAISIRFAEDGASLVINYAGNDEAAQETLEGIKKLGAKAIAIKADIRDEKQVEQMVRKTIEAFGKVDILINNAGVVKDRSIRNMTLDDWNLVIGINLTGAFLCTREVVKYMIEAKYGKIVNIGSRAMWGNIGQANYSASKGGVASMTCSLALELARYNINVNCVAPGGVNTEMVSNCKEEIRERLRQAQPTGNLGESKDVANVVAFFASDDASYITGETILVDGGKQIAAGAMGRIIRS